jgi:UV DNA damage endonuclease
MLARLGFVASVLSEDLSTSRTCRLRNATVSRIRDLIAENLQALDGVVSFLDRHDIRLYRISSNVIPYASHHVNTLAWWDEYAGTLKRLGRRLRRRGIRVSTHPGQYTVLNSPHQPIVRAASAELMYHARLLDALDAAEDCKIVVHVGGLYGDSERVAAGRFVSTVKSLPSPVRRRLVVENDDRLFDADEVLRVGKATSIPVVFDWLHHRANPCARPVSQVLEDIFATWKRHDGRPKIHLSSQAANGPAGAHAEYVNPRDLVEFLAVAPDLPFDCMLEAKQKDRALLRLREELKPYNIEECDLRSDDRAQRASSLHGQGAVRRCR